MRNKEQSTLRNKEQSTLRNKEQSTFPDHPRRTITIVGDSMIKEIQGWKLSKNPRTVVKSFSGAKVADMYHYVQPSLEKNPDEIIMHIGTNDIKLDTIPQSLADSIVDLCDSVERQAPGTSISISGIVRRNDDAQLNTIISKVNKCLQKFSHQRGWNYIDNYNIDHTTCLNRSKLHLNKKGTYIMSNNFRSHILKQ